MEALPDDIMSYGSSTRCDNDSNDSIISPKLTEKAALQRIAKMTAITLLQAQVAL